MAEVPFSDQQATESAYSKKGSDKTAGLILKQTTPSHRVSGDLAQDLAMIGMLFSTEGKMGKEIIELSQTIAKHFNNVDGWMVNKTIKAIDAGTPKGAKGGGRGLFRRGNQDEGDTNDRDTERD